MAPREVVKSPRVGLTLKKLDDKKPAFWLADYRSLSHPEFHSKMKDFILLSMISKGATTTSICARANCKIQKVEDLRIDFDKGLKMSSTMEKEHKENMKAADWA